MKKHVLLAKMLMTLAFTGALSWGSLTSVYAQISSYSFAESTETYAQITGTTSTATGDDGSQNGIAIGFTFNFGGTDYTTFSINTNGFIRLGANIGASSWTNSIANANTTQSPIVAAFWDDNHLSTGTIRYSTSGSAPDRVLTVDWNQFKIGGGGSTAGASNNMQIRLYETTNVIEYVYGATFVTTNTVTAFVGINNAGSFLSVTPGAPSTASNSTQNHAINNSVMTNLAGKKLTFTPPSCIAPGGLNASLVSTTEGNFSWNAAVPAPGVGYEYAITTSATPPASGTATTGLTVNNNMLTANTAYWLHVRSECDPGVFSGWSTISFNTTPGLGCALPVAVTPGAFTYPTLGAGANSNVCFTAGTSGYWYSFTPAEDGLMTVKSCGNVDTRLSILSGTCSSLTCVAQNDDDGDLACHPNGWASSVVDLAVVGGTTYYIFWNNGYTSTSSNWTLSFTPPLPAPDCASNFVVTPDANCANYPIDFSWDAVAGASGYFLSIGITPGGNEIANNVDWGNETGFILTDALASTTYYYTVTPYNASSSAVGCTEQSYTTGAQSCYCLPTNTNIGDRISAFSTSNALQNVSTSSLSTAAYEDYTSETIVAAQGSTVNFTGTYVGGSAGLAIWIDFDNSLTFEASERVFVTTTTSASWTNSFQVPVGQAPGIYRMRIRAQWLNATPPACGNISWGQAEDYTFVVVSNQTTQLRAIDCGATNVSMNQIVRATQIGAPNYRFRITGANNGGPGWNNNQFIYDTPIGQNHFRFQFIPGAVWGATYAVEVAAGDVNGFYGPYGNSCNVTLENQTTTQITAATCGATVTMGDFVLADWAPGAVGYRFRIQGANNGGAGWSGNTFIYETTAPVRSFKFNNHIPGALFGETYSIDVAVLSGDNVWLPYGSACNVTIATPSTQIQASQCGITGVALSTSVLADNVVGASGYRFRITGANSANWMNDQFILNRSNRVMQFQMVAGVLPGEIYQVEVAVMDANGNYGAYGSSCNVTLEGTPSIVINDENEIFMADKSLVEVAFGANASHNPFTTEFGIQVLNANDTETINVVIYDMSGKLIERNAVNPMDIEAVKFGSNLASGMYMIEVRQGSNQAVIRQVKN